MLRPTLLATLLLLPLSGCLGGGPQASIGLFDLSGAIPDDPTPLPVPSCAVLLDALNQRALDEARAALEQSVEHGGWYGMGDVAIGFAMADSSESMAAPSSSAGTSTGASGASTLRGAGRQVTGTNNQETEADEGDLVKTDGTWTYVLTNDGVLHVLHHAALGDVERAARVVLGEGRSWGGGHLLLEPRGPGEGDDRLVVLLPNSAPDAQGLSLLTSPMRDRASYGMTRILVLDVGDRTAPLVESETLIEGQPNGVRLIDGIAHVVVQRWSNGLGLQTYAEPDQEDLRMIGFVDRIGRVSEDAMKDLRRRAAVEADAANQRILEEATLRDHLPLVLTATGGHASPEPLGEEQCKDVLATPGPTGRSVSTIFSLDVAGDLASETVQVLGSSAIVYASGDALVLAAPTTDTWWASAQAGGVTETTDLHWFDVDGLAVTHRASGRVAGSILDSFALDVRGDRLRVASTLNTWRWVADEPMASQVTVLAPVAGILVPSGTVGGIAPTEKIWSVRFTDDRAYVVTFRNMDPLWVIDLSGDVPVVLGELEIPGVSTYLHPLDDGALLAIGYAPAGEDGFGIDWGSVQVSLFDLTDLTKPRRADVVDLVPPGGSWGSGSEAINEHKAFTYWDEVGRLAVPVASYGGYDGAHVSALQFVTVDRAKMDLSLSGQVNQSQLPTDSNWYGTGIQRSFFLGYPPLGPVSVYAVSPRGVTAHDLTTLEPQGSVAFESAQPTYGHYID